MLTVEILITVLILLVLAIIGVAIYVDRDKQKICDKHCKCPACPK